MGSSPTPGTMEELNKYIKSQLSFGVDQETIKTKLVDNGWESSTVESAIGYCTGAKKQSLLTKNIVIGILAVVLILISVGGVYGYFFYTKSPEVVLLKAIQNMKSMQSFNHKGEFLLDLNFRDELFGSIDEEVMINFKGSTDREDKLNAIDFTINGNSEVDGLEVSLKSADNFLYAKIVDAPEIILTEAPFLIGQWLGMDTGEAFKMAEIDEPKISEDELVSLFLKHRDNFLIITESSLTTDSFYIYNINIDRAGFLEFVKDVDRLTEEDLDVVKIEGFVKAIDDIDLEVWISKEDLMFTKFVSNFHIKDNIGELKLFLSINLSDYDNVEAITIPQTFKTFDEIMTDYLLYSVDTFDILADDDFLIDRESIN